MALNKCYKSTLHNDHKIIPIEQYIDEKINLLKKHLMIKLTNKEITYLKSLTTEIQVDNAAKSIIKKHWNME